MIEAIPVNLDSIILIITKVEDPDELDTRFSKFSPYKENSPAEPLQLDGADNIIDIFQKICEAKRKQCLRDYFHGTFLSWPQYGGTVGDGNGKLSGAV